MDKAWVNTCVCEPSIRYLSTTQRQQALLCPGGNRRCCFRHFQQELDVCLDLVGDRLERAHLRAEEQIHGVEPVGVSAGHVREFLQHSLQLDQDSLGSAVGDFGGRSDEGRHPYHVKEVLVEVPTITLNTDTSAQEFVEYFGLATQGG